MKEHRCEVCCQRVSLHNDSYGTHFYLPMERRVTIVEVQMHLRRLSTDPQFLNLSATDALIRASQLLSVDQPASTT